LSISGLLLSEKADAKAEVPACQLGAIKAPFRAQGRGRVSGRQADFLREGR